MFKSDSGSRYFHPYDKSWSYRGLGSDALIRIKIHIKTNVFIRNHTTGGRKPHPSQPPKNKAVVMADTSVMPAYSPTKNIPNLIPEYSE